MITSFSLTLDSQFIAIFSTALGPSHLLAPSYFSEKLFPRAQILPLPILSPTHMKPLNLEAFLSDQTDRSIRSGIRTLIVWKQPMKTQSDMQ